MRKSGRIIFIAISIFLIIGKCPVSQAQKIVVNSRDNLSIAVGYSIPLGSKLVNQQPALVANMQPGISTDISYLTSMGRKLHVGVSISHTSFKGWSFSDYPLFQNSSISFLSVGPTLAYRTWSPTKFSQNKVNFFGALTPGVSKIEVRTDAESIINEGSKTNPLKVSSSRLFVRAEAGVNLNVSQNAAILISIDYQYTASDSQVFTDRSYSFLSFKLGASLRLVKDKYYKFSL